MDPPVPVPAAPGTRPASDGAFRRAAAGLTEAQCRAVDSPAARLCVVAGAGSGKTRVLTLRVARRVLDGSAQADHTLVCTFTRKAARELRARLAASGAPVSSPVGPGGVPASGVRAGTLHQLALTLLRREADDTGRAVPVLVDHRARLLAELVDGPARAAAVDAEIAWAKARCLGPAEYARAATAAGRDAVPGEWVAATYAAYQAALGRRGQLDLDDVLLRAGDLLLADGAAAERARWRYRHLFVDEFQDVNPAQFRLLTALLGEGADLCVVGDPNQAIYGWNGADAGLLRSLPDVLAGLETVHLDRNHRCTPQVVAAAAAALGQTEVAPPRSARPDGPMPVVTAYDDERAEAEGVASLVLDRSAAGTAWSDQAVLARTHDQLGVVRRALERAGVPWRDAPGPESEGEADGAPPGGRGAVELATFHRAKGLEWTSVFVVGLEEGYVPVVHAATDEARAEERRLLYVALSRASRDLHCSWARSRRLGAGRAVERRASPWLAPVARASRAGQDRSPPRDVGSRLAQLRAGLRR